MNKISCALLLLQLVLIDATLSPPGSNKKGKTKEKEIKTSENRHFHFFLKNRYDFYTSYN